MSKLDREYLERRRRECLAHADEAADPAIARVHREFADAYQQKLLAGEPERLRTVGLG